MESHESVAAKAHGPNGQGLKAMQAVQQRLMDQTKQAVNQHLTMKQEEWNNKVEEAVQKNTILAFKLRTTMLSQRLPDWETWTNKV